MCKCCQSIFESCYWHCYGKWHFDEDIALYEDEKMEKKKDSRAMDNIAFWDSVQTLASRSAILTQPAQSLPNLTQLEVPKTPNNNIKINVDSPSSFNSSITNLTDEEKIGSELTPNDQKKYRKKSAVEEMIKKKQTPNEERQRKKSLKERRNSTADLTLDLSVKLGDDFHDIPITRQESVPKFYTNATPEYNPFAPTLSLVSPILPQCHTPKFDLKSVVQIENEIELSSANARAKRSASKLENAKRKMKLVLIKKQASTKSLPDSINHI